MVGRKEGNVELFDSSDSLRMHFPMLILNRYLRILEGLSREHMYKLVYPNKV